MTQDSKLILLEPPKFKPITATKIPKRMGTVADMLYKTRQTRLAFQHVVDDLKVQERVLKDHVLANLPKSNATGISGSVANVRSVPKAAIRAADWDKIYRYIKRHDAFEMLQRRLADVAVRERLDAAGKRGLPGIEESGYADISLTKI